MNLKILFMLLIYYMVISLTFGLGGAYLTDYNTSVDLQADELASEEIDRGGLFGTGISFTRFTTLLLFGIGLPSTTPTWFALIFSLWQTVLFIFTVGFIISSIWNG